MGKKYSEKRLEKNLREGVKELGGMALKFASQSFTGLPDRIVLLPDSRILWVEVKSTGKALRDEQLARKRMLESRGHLVYTVDDQESLSVVLDKVGQEYGINLSDRGRGVTS